MKTARDWDEPFEGEPSGPGPIGLPPPRTVTRALLWGLGVIGVIGFLAGDVGLGRRVYETLALNPVQWREWFPFVPLWQLATYGALHSTSDPMHLLFNLLALYGFGSLFEGVFGARRMAWWFAAAVVIGGVAQLAYNLAVGANAPTVGASGAVMFLIVAMATIQPNLPVFFLIIRMRLRTLALILVALDLLRVVWAIKGAGGDVAFVVHLCGAALGFFGVRRSWMWLDPLAELRTRRQAREVVTREQEERRLDQLLERIHSEGIGSLSASEREFLKRMSSRRNGGV